MRKLFLICVAYIFSIQNTLAQIPSQGGITGLPDDKLRKGEIHTEDIPYVIRNIINFGLNIAGTIAIIFIIIGAYKMLFGSLQQDVSKGRNTIIMAITGFILAALAWFIIKIVIDNI